MFVSEFVHNFLACLHAQDTFKGSVYTSQVDPVKKVVSRWSTIDRNSSEACLVAWDRVV